MFKFVLIDFPLKLTTRNKKGLHTMSWIHYIQPKDIERLRVIDPLLRVFVSQLNGL